MSRIARSSVAPVTVRTGGKTFEFDESGKREVTEPEEEILRAYEGPVKFSFETKKTRRKSTARKKSTAKKSSTSSTPAASTASNTAKSPSSDGGK